MHPIQWVGNYRNWRLCCFQAFNLDDDLEDDEIIAFSNKKQLGVASVNNRDISPHQQVADELANLGDDIASSAFTNKFYN